MPSRRPVSRLLPAFAALLLGLVAGGCRTVEIGAGNLLSARPDRPLTAEAVQQELPEGYRLEEQRLSAPGDTSLYGVLLHPPQAGRTVLFFGPNGFRISQNGRAVAQALAQPACPARVMLVDYRGSGRSAGTPSVDALKADALLAFDALAARPDVDAAQIVVYGHSLGSLAASLVARERETGGVVLEGAMTTVEALAEGLVNRQAAWYQRPFVNVRVGASLEGEGSLRDVRALGEPLLVLVGENDATTPPSFSRRLYREAGVPEAQKHLRIFEGTGHTGVKRHAQFAEVYCRFLDGRPSPPAPGR